MQTSETTLKDRHRGVHARSVIEEAKELVPVIDLADRLCGPGQMRRVGKEWVARCPLPGHDDRIPSFSVNPDKSVCFCHGCRRGGDVVHLAAFAWGHDRMDTAAAEVLHTFGHPIPERPAAWYRKQERQKAVRDLIDEAKVEVLARRLWRAVFQPILSEMEDEDGRKQMARRLWPKVEASARYLLAERRQAG
jgi:hypothetical protein